MLTPSVASCSCNVCRGWLVRALLLPCFKTTKLHLLKSYTKNRHQEPRRARRAWCPCAWRCRLHRAARSPQCLFHHQFLAPCAQPSLRLSGQQTRAPHGAGLLTPSSGFFLFILGIFFPPLFLAGKGGKQYFLGAAEHLGCSRLSRSTSPSNTLLLACFPVVLLPISPFGPAPISENGYTVVSNAFLSIQCAGSD